MTDWCAPDNCPASICNGPHIAHHCPNGDLIVMLASDTVPCPFCGWQPAVAHWFAEIGTAHAKEVDRLWPDEDDPGYRAQSLGEEALEVSRAITKRRHASHAKDGKCKGKTVDEWSNELRLELAQALGVILDIAYREGIELMSSTEECVRTLQQREAGT